MTITELSSLKRNPSWLLGIFLYACIKARDDSCCVSILVDRMYYVFTLLSFNDVLCSIAK